MSGEDQERPKKKKGRVSKRKLELQEVEAEEIYEDWFSGET
jgi:hypothetical protein